MGNAGEINVTTPNLTLTDFSSIDADTSGKGNGGLININATESITLDDSYISITASFGTEGNAGEINITTPNLTLTNVSSIDVETFAQGDSGKLSINAANLSLTDISSITGDTFGQGNGGLFNINATESITLDNSYISSEVKILAQGNGGKLSITTPNLSLTNGGSIRANTSGQGDAGSIKINVPGLITLDNSFISSTVQFDDAKGNGGKLSITTPNLSLTNFSSISADTSGQGDAGSTKINVSGLITLDNSSISSTVQFADVKGNGGNIEIATSYFSLTNNASVDASTSGIGNGGEINITANNLSLANGGIITASTSGSNADNIAQGDGGNITIDIADTLDIDGASLSLAGIFASNQGNSSGSAGNIGITTSKLSVINDGQINSFTGGGGNAGNVTINAQDSIFLSGESSDDFYYSGVSSDVIEAASGNGGTISVTTDKLDIFDGAYISTSSKGQGDAGLIDIDVNVLSLDNGSITAQAFNKVDGGNLEIDANVIVAFPDGDSDIQASAEQGNGGSITINAESLLGIEQRPLNNATNDINASSQVRGLDGTVRVNTLDINPIQGATELPSNIVEAKQTADQTCSADRDGKATNGLAIAGRGGVSPKPDAPLSSASIIDSQGNYEQTAIPEPIETAQGKIQPARGIKFTKDGRIILTAYPTNNEGERIPEIKPNCKRDLGTWGLGDLGN